VLVEPWRPTCAPEEEEDASALVCARCSLRSAKASDLSAIGEVYTCLFGSQGADLRAVVRANSDDATRAAALDAAIAQLWAARADRYSELRAAHTGARSPRKVGMSHIGG